MKLAFGSEDIFDLYGLHEKLQAENILGYSGVSLDYNSLFVEFPTVNEVSQDDVVKIEAIIKSHTGKKSWDMPRKKRAVLFGEVDWRIQRAEDRSEDATSLRLYRQALRDITEQGDPDNVVWPEKPWSVN